MAGERGGQGREGGRGKRGAGERGEGELRLISLAHEAQTPTQNKNKSQHM